MSEWQKRTLNELGDFMSGGGFPIIYQGETSGDYPFYKVSDLNNIGNESCLDRSNNYIHEDVRRKLGLKLIPQNSIVFAKIGAAVYLERKRIMIHNGLIDNNMAAFIGNGTTIEKLMYYIFQLIRIGNYTNTTALPAVDLRGLGHHEAYYPVDPKEQSRIAAVLTAADEAIAASRSLVEKYAAVKQGLMRDLLGKGERMKLERCLRICYGKDQKQIEVTDGIYPILGSGGEMGRTNTYLYNKPSVLIGRKGTIDNPLYIETPFWSIDTMYYTEIFNGYLPKYLYYVFTLIPWYKYNEASGVPSLSGSTIHKIEVNIPDLNEQIRIAEILTTADERLAAERERLMKLEDIKRGLMDDLLTNRVSTDKLQGGI